MESLNWLESNILVWIQENLRITALDVIMPYISKINNAGALAIATVVVLLLIKKYRNVGITAFTSLFTEFILVNVLLKQIICRTRPFYVNDALQYLGTLPKDFSFPSGHTGSSFAVATVMLMCMPKKYGVTAIVVATLIALSRLYNGVHYPTDVLAALMIGVLTSICAVKVVFPKVNTWLQKRETE